MDSSHRAGLALLTLSTVVSAGLVWYAKRPAIAAASIGAIAGSTVPNWELLARQGIEVRSGPRNRTMLVFSDYQCAACRRLDAAIDSLHGTYRVTEIVRHFPVIDDSVSVAAAIAVDCVAAERQAPDLHRRLFRETSRLSSPRVRAMARLLEYGVDTARVDRCLADSTSRSRVLRDRALARSLHLTGTPAWVVGGVLYYGDRTAAELRAILTAAEGAQR